MPWINVTQTTRITDDPARLHGLVLLTSANGGDATLYDGPDAAAGRKIARFEALANDSRFFLWDPPLECDRGIYVDVGSSVTEVLIHWDPK